MAKVSDASLQKVQESVIIGRNSINFKKREVKALRINEQRSYNGDEKKGKVNSVTKRNQYDFIKEHSNRSSQHQTISTESKMMEFNPYQSS